MTTIKPIQATPVLSGRDADRIIKQANQKPTTESIKKNLMLSDVLAAIRKS